MKFVYARQGKKVPITPLIQQSTKSTGTPNRRIEAHPREQLV